MVTKLMYNFAVYREVVFGDTHYQGHGFTPDYGWLPVDSPKPLIGEARLDCHVAFQALKRVAPDTDFRLDPEVRNHDWSSNRRNLR